jgi:hypothetical protein
MATTTPNYGWTVPTSSDLVKNGATAIETLGDSVDDSLWNSGYGQAGKNKILNGDFTVNQRSFTSTTTSDVYGFDRWFAPLNDGTCTYSAQTFTAGAAPVAGYEGTNFARIVTTGQTLTTARAAFTQRIENVRNFAGQTATISFWAKAASGTPNVSTEFVQNFGTGGSPSASVTAIGVNKIAITTAWVRYSATVSFPSISGKTVGTTANTSYVQFALYVSAGSTYDARTNTLGIQTNTFDIWGLQLEYGSKATPFQLAGGGDPQSELAMCQRYYYRTTATGTGIRFGYGTNISTTDAQIMVTFPVQMRTAPTALDQTGTAGDYSITEPAGATAACTSVPAFLLATLINAIITLTSTVGTLTQYRSSSARAGSSTVYLGWSAEL